jgi:hypothetical protein
VLFGLVAVVLQAPQETIARDEYVVVRHVLVASPDGTIAVEEESREIAEFKVNPNLWQANKIPVPVSYNPSGEPGGLNAPNVIQNAIGTWNGAGSGFSFIWGGTSGGDTGSCLNDFETDGANTIRFEKLSGLTLGRTCTIFGNGKLVEFDMELDSDGTWSVGTPVPGNAYDLATTVLHELGHALGLGHSCGEGGPVCNSTLRDSVMYRQVSAGESRRELTADDLEAIQTAYPGQAPTATATISATPTTPTPTASTTPITIATTTATPTATQSAPFPLFQVRVRAPLLSKD